MGALSGSSRSASGRASDELDTVRAALLLQRLPGVGDAGLDGLVERFGGTAAAWAAPRQAFAQVAGARAAAARGEPQRLQRVDEALAWARENDVRVVDRWAPGYPARLADVPNPPGVLFLKGDRSLLDAEIVTIVGSRRSTEYGRRVAGEVARLAARSGIVVASGLALGIDGEAHRAALESGGGTVAVLGSGLARLHPRSHARLFRQIAREGLVVSEFLPGELPLPFHFPRRNRTLAALARVVVVVEAAERSGALNTATHAIELGRDLLAVPGSIYAPMSRGTNALLDHAAALVSPESLLEFFPRAVQGELDLSLQSPPDDLGGDALSLWGVIEETPRHVDELVRRSRLAPGETLTALSLLELGGWVRQEPGARFARSGP